MLVEILFSRPDAVQAKTSSKLPSFVNVPYLEARRWRKNGAKHETSPKDCVSAQYHLFAKVINIVFDQLFEHTRDIHDTKKNGTSYQARKRIVDRRRRVGLSDLKGLKDLSDRFNIEIGFK